MIEQLVAHLLCTFRKSLPVLNNIVVLLPGPESRTDFYQSLLDQLPESGTQAVIPPWCGTLNDWVTEFVPLPDPHVTVISEQARRIMFIEALQQHSALFREENKWQVTLSLLKLFDEINLHNVDIPDSSEQWIETVRQAYGINQQHQHLIQEATLIHILWHAWYEQLHARQQLDSSSAYAISLGALANSPPENIHFFALDTTDYSPGEQACLDKLQQKNLCTLLPYAQLARQIPALSNNQAVSDFIHTAFDHQQAPLKQRAEDFAHSHSNVDLPFNLFLARDAETETRAVEVKIRQWLLAGKNNIAVISEDRKCSRRLRALLERANIPLYDISGWSLATTSTAAVLERWLECIEQDFDYRPLLDLLKSRFFKSGDHEQHLKNVYRLETDIILHEQTGHGLARYKRHLQYRLNKLEHWPRNSYDQIFELLELLQTSAATLNQLYHARYPVKLSQFFDALSASLHTLGLYNNFLLDPAGTLIVQNLESMQQSFTVADPRLTWTDFRTWLATTLEETLFRPPVETTPVKLMTLEQAGLQTFDGLIIAAADDEHLPGYADVSPFFNQGVRHSLGLPTWELMRARRLEQFKRLLASAADVLITCKSEDKGDPVVLSPWITSLQNFAALALDQSLEDRTLSDLLNNNTEVFICDTTETPDITEQPAPGVAAQLIPDAISASSHQRLINCPYQYFVSDILGLKPAEEIIDELKKSDYGERVHLALQAFHTQVKNLPPPFGEMINEQNRAQATQHLIELSHIVFKRDLEDNVLHRSWLHRWLEHIPAYIDWQIKQTQGWSLAQTELRMETALNEYVNLTGRIDRIDQNETGKSIIDYKTGYSAHQNDVDCGEDIQLATYALLEKNAQEVKYVNLDGTDGKVQTGAQLTGDQLDSMREQTGDRLVRLFTLLSQGRQMPAWGDEHTCSYCDYTGLCRKPVWHK